MKEKIIVAIDVQDKESFDSLCSNLKGNAQYLKIGMELFYTFGPDIIKETKNMGFDIFLDLKIHDIPNTAFSAAKTLSKLGVDMINVHATGGIEMMKAAKKGSVEGAKEANKTAPILIAVTQLTSSNVSMLNEELLIPKTMEECVVEYARNVKEAGLDGVVCAAQDVKEIKRECGDSFLCITPGIRPAGSSKQDQKRVMTPTEAIQTGSDYLVIGRPITKADNPTDAFNIIVEEIKNV